jgi:hypothetical protein
LHFYYHACIFYTIFNAAIKPPSLTPFVKGAGGIFLHPHLVIPDLISLPRISASSRTGFIRGNPDFMIPETVNFWCGYLLMLMLASKDEK